MSSISTKASASKGSRNSSSGAICLALASAPYDEDDYIREYDDFRRAKQVR
jgi:WxcM-like, C-terminal